MAKCFSKKYGNKGSASLPANLCQVAYQHLMLHPYITASRIIINFVLSYVESGIGPSVTSLVKGGLFGSYAIKLLSMKFRLREGMVSHMQVLATHFSTVHNTNTWFLTSETILVLAGCS